MYFKYFEHKKLVGSFELCEIKNLLKNFKYKEKYKKYKVFFYAKEGKTFDLNSELGYYIIETSSYCYLDKSDNSRLYLPLEEFSVVFDYLKNRHFMFHADSEDERLFKRSPELETYFYKLLDKS